MKKVLLTAIIAMCFAISSSAQTFAKNDNVVGLNVGLGGSYGIPVSLSFERGIYDINKDMSIGVGGLVGYGSSSEDFGGIGEWSYSNIVIGARGSYHYTAINKLDLFAGLTLGYDIVSAKWKGQGAGGEADGSAIFWGLHAGARYYFNDNWGVNAEVGYGLAYLNIGLSYKF